MLTIDKIQYIRDPKDSTKNHVELMNTLSKLAGYNSNFKKSVDTQLNINGRHPENERGNSIHNNLIVNKWETSK